MGFVHLYLVSHVIRQRVFLISATKTLYFILLLLVLVASVKHLCFAVESRIFW